jgi:peptide/nickel transport system ATP-binding protein
MAGHANNTLLRVEELSVQFHTDRGIVRALEKVSLSLGKGEVLGLIGESGSGKTTTARSILRILPSSARITSGSVIFMGRDLLTMQERELNSEIRGRRITLVPQDPFNSLNPVFSVGTQIRDIIKWKGDRGSSGRQLQMIREILR